MRRRALPVADGQFAGVAEQFAGIVAGIPPGLENRADDLPVSGGELAFQKQGAGSLGSALGIDDGVEGEEGGGARRRS